MTIGRTRFLSRYRLNMNRAKLKPSTMKLRSQRTNIRDICRYVTGARVWTTAVRW